jgi:hypothetical protein
MSLTGEQVAALVADQLEETLKNFEYKEFNDIVHTALNRRLEEALMSVQRRFRFSVTPHVTVKIEGDDLTVEVEKWYNPEQCQHPNATYGANGWWCTRCGETGE